MKRLKEDLGITLERTGEWDYWTDNEGQEIHFKLKNPPKNKFIDLDTFVIYCELRREGAEMPTYQVKFRLPFSKLEGGERYLYYSDMQLIGGNTYHEIIYPVNAYSLLVNLNQSVNENNNGEIEVGRFKDEIFEHLENVHIYYAYTTLQEFMYYEM